MLLATGDNQWLVTDLGHWGSRDGKVTRLTAKRGQPAELEPLLTGLQNPHGLNRGPDGKIYVAETGRIFRFDPGSPNPAASRETVITGLLSNQPVNRHPLIFFPVRHQQ